MRIRRHSLGAAMEVVIAPRTLSHLKVSQASWAARGQLAIDRRGYAATIQENLFLRSLHPDTAREFAEADGEELTDSPRRPAKMRSLLSSSALAVNFFDPWRDTSKDGLAAALELSPIATLRFEYKCPKFPVKPRSPNLDVWLTLTDGRSVAIESKFTEPYNRTDTAISERYFDGPTGLWDAVGLSRAQKLANELRSPWVHVDVPQIIKHLLGIAAAHPAGQNTLLYLWFDAGTEESLEHATELQRLALELSGDPVTFRPVSYQQVFERWQRAACADPVPGWGGYLRSRYFARAVANVSER